MTFTDISLLKQIKNKPTLPDFIKYVVDNEITDIGHIYEWVSSMCIMFGVSKYGKNIKIYSGDSQRLKIKIINLDELTVNNGSAEGAGDIKFIFDDKLYCFSVKYYKNDDNKLPKAYDIIPIITKYSKNNLNKTTKVGLICNNSVSVLQKFSKVHDKDNKKKLLNISDNLFGINDVSQWYKTLRIVLAKLNHDKNEIYDFLYQDMEFIKPRLHQHICVEKIQKLFSETNHVLLNAICRCGKTFIGGHLVSKYNYKRVLLITPRPTSTKESYEIMINNYRNFSKYSKGINSYDNEEHEIILDDTIEYNFTVLSRQLLADRHKTIDYSYFDLIILDETQKMCSDNMLIEIEKMKQNNCKILNMTATSSKVERIMNFNEKYIIRYGLNNIMDYQEGNLYSFGKEYVDEYLQNISDKDSVIKYYQGLPQIKMYHPYLIPDERLYDDQKGFTFKKLFALKRKGLFSHEKSIISIFRQLLGDPRGDDDSCILNSIEDEADNSSKNNNISIIYLPYGIGLKIKDTLNAILKLMKSLTDLSDDYHFIGYSSEDINLFKLDGIVTHIENERKKCNKKVIVFIGGMLEVGCSIPYADNVIMMNDSDGIDSYLQRMFRCLTENVGENGEIIKKVGNVIDFNPNNILRGSLEIFKDTKMSESQKMKFILKKKMVRILNGDFKIQDMDTETIHEIYREMKRIDILRDELYEFNENYLLLKSSEIMKNMRGEITKITRDTIELDKREKNEPTSYDIIRSETEDSMIVEDNELVENLSKNALLIQQARESCKLLCNWLCVRMKCKVLNLTTDTLEYFKKDPVFADSIIEYLHTITNIKQLKSHNEYYLQLKVFFSVCEKILKSWDFINIQLGSLIKKDIDNIIQMNDYDGLLEYFTKLINPTMKEKKSRGEVFTPLELVNEMLDKLPEEVWTNPDLVWLDPANGIGNFPVCVFTRLMKSLVYHFPDEKLRRKHILENMIYVCELDRKNCFLYNLLLGQGVQLNVYQGDSLALDLENHTWQNGKVIKAFDIVMGNPPYQKNLYKKFTLKFIYCKRLLFVIPSTWTVGISSRPFEEHLKSNGLKEIIFLDRIFNNVDIDTLYFYKDNEYISDFININNIKTRKKLYITNHISVIEYNIFEKIFYMNKLKISKGNNHTLTYKNPIETDNIKFNPTNEHKNILISRLNGGNFEKYYIKNFKKLPGNKILFPRGTGSYNSLTNLKNLSKDIVNCFFVDDTKIISNTILYMNVIDYDEYLFLKFYLMKSKFIRFIFIKQNKFAELTKGLFNFIPYIDFKECNLTDESIYKYLKLTPEEIDIVENYIN